MEGSDDGEAGKMDPWTHSRNGCKPSGFLWMSGLLIPLKKRDTSYFGFMG